MTLFKSRPFKILITLLLMTYIGSFLYLSRTALSQARDPEFGYWFVEPDRDHQALFEYHTAILYFYSPLIFVDHYVFGTTEPFQSAPFYGMDD